MNHAAAVFVKAKALEDQVGDAAELFRSGTSDIDEVVACGVDSKHIWERSQRFFEGQLRFPVLFNVLKIIEAK